MKFPDRYERAASHDLLQPALEVRQGRDDLEATGGEPDAVVSFGRGEPVEGAAQRW